MVVLQLLLWSALFIVFYAYVGYALLLYAMVLAKRATGHSRQAAPEQDQEPAVTVLIAAYNEIDYVDAKVANVKQQVYPQDRIHQIWISDGSADGTAERLAAYACAGVEVWHNPERRGKAACLNQGMALIGTPITVFSDANAMLNPTAIQRIVRQFSEPDVGCVAGEKRIRESGDGTAAETEGIYWRYESALKRWDAELNSAVGADGGLFAIRTSLYRPVEADTLLDDLVISLRVAMQGYTIQYDPEAYVVETASANVHEELKRRVRISAGGIQSILRLRSLLNMARYGLLSFQYISHRVLRWTLAPLALPVIFIAAGVLARQAHWFAVDNLYVWLFWAQVLFYFVALLGWLSEYCRLRVRAVYVPYYFVMMNVAVYWGLARFLRGRQTVNWEKAQRGI